MLEKYRFNGGHVGFMVTASVCVARNDIGEIVKPFFFCSGLITETATKWNLTWAVTIKVKITTRSSFKNACLETNRRGSKFFILLQTPFGSKSYFRMKSGLSEDTLF